MGDDVDHSICSRIIIGARSRLSGTSSQMGAGRIAGEGVLDGLAMIGLEGVPSAILSEKPRCLHYTWRGENKIDAIRIDFELRKPAANRVDLEAPAAV